LLYYLIPENHPESTEPVTVLATDAYTRVESTNTTLSQLLDK